MLLFQTREQEELEEALEVERQENEQRRLFIQKEEQMQQILKRKNKQAFLDELVCINVDYDKNICLQGLSFLLCWVMVFKWHFYSLCSCIYLLSLYFIYLLIYVLAVLHVGCCMWAFSSSDKWRLLFIVVHGLLVAVASLVA